MLPKVSLLICTFKRDQELVNCLRCALKQDYDNYEIIVVDQLPEHDATTQTYLENVNANIKYHNVNTPGLTKARNYAVEHSTGSILIFIDDDTEFTSQFIQAHVRQHENADVVQGRITEPGRKPKQNKPQWMMWYLKVKGTNDCTIAGKTNTLTGCNFSIKRSIYEQVGPFDEKYDGLAIREDSDYGMRCYCHKVKMVFSPEAGLTHLRSSRGGVDYGIGEHFFSLSYYKNELYFARKFFPWPIVHYYKFRLFLRGKKALRKLIKQAEKICKEQ